MPKRILPTSPPSRRVSVFRNGRNQAVRIPRDFEFQADEVLVVKEGNRLILEPLDRAPSLLEVLAALGPLGEKFPDVDESLMKLDAVEI